MKKEFAVCIIFLIVYFFSFPVSPSNIIYSETEADYIVPDIIHQIYDYQSPNLFLYLSILSIQYFHQPKRHILWVNDEGRYRKGHWESWQRNPLPHSWEEHFSHLLQNKTIEIHFTTFPAHPPGNQSIFVSNKAHRSDFLRMKVLHEMGGVYIDTDTITTRPLHELRKHNFTLSFDNIVNKETSQLPKRLNNGVIVSSKEAIFLKIWMKEYRSFRVHSFDYDSSVVPYRLATLYPDLIHLEMNRISPISYGFQTSKLAEAITCGIYIPPGSFAAAAASTASSTASTLKGTIPNYLVEFINQQGAIWYPEYSSSSSPRKLSYENVLPDVFMFQEVKKKLILHLTMSQVRGLCMLRKTLTNVAQFDQMPSYLGRLFRLSYYRFDSFPYEKILHEYSMDQKNALFQSCRDQFGMHSASEPDEVMEKRQQYVRWRYSSFD